jgi:hypothetical protein
MEWIQRNPKKTVGLAALAVLVVVIIIWGTSGGSDSGKSTLGGPPLATPTATPSDKLTAFPTPSDLPSSASDVMQALASFDAQHSAFGDGSSSSLSHHRVVVAAGSDGPMMAVGWWIPLADGKRQGADTSKSKTFRHSDTTWGDGDLARILAFGGPYSRTTWCTVTVDGRVTERQEAKGPWSRVFCQG